MIGVVRLVTCCMLLGCCVFPGLSMPQLVEHMLHAHLLSGCWHACVACDRETMLRGLTSMELCNMRGLVCQLCLLGELSLYL